MNIIIVGCGKVGQKIAAKLSKESDLNITVVDLRSNVIEDIMNVSGIGEALFNQIKDYITI